MSITIPAAKRRRARQLRSAGRLFVFVIGTFLIALVIFDMVGR